MGYCDGEPPQLVHFGIADSDAWDVGLPCGGEIDVWVQAYEPGRFEEIARAGGRAAEVTLLEGAPPGAKLLVEAGRGAIGVAGRARARRRGRPRGRASCCGPMRPSARTGLFVDVVAPPPRLILFGAVDIAGLAVHARPRGRLAAVRGRPAGAVCDRRSGSRTPRRSSPRGPRRRWRRSAAIDPATSIVVLTHDPKLDDAALQIALRSPARFIGAMGSRRAQAKRRERLLAPGIRRGRARAHLRAGRPGPRRDQRARRPRYRSWPRSSQRGTAARAAGSRESKGRIHEVPGLICGLILAAGAGTRFGDESKLLAELEGVRCWSTQSPRNARSTELERIVVVLGAHAERILRDRSIRARGARGVRGLERRARRCLCAAASSLTPTGSGRR